MKKKPIFIYKTNWKSNVIKVCVYAYPTDSTVVCAAYRRKRRCLLTISSPIDTSKYSILKYICNKYILRMVLLLLLFIYYSFFSGMKNRPVPKIWLFPSNIINNTCSKSLANNFCVLQVLSVFHYSSLNN